MPYELWDGELGVRLGVYDSREAALAAVRRLASEPPGSVAPLGLTADGTRLVASGEQLVELARQET
jgi:hypothetical protein